MPILYTPLLAMGRTLPRRHKLWPEALVACAASAGLIAIYAVIISGVSGYNFGFRYLIPLIPFVLFFAPAAFEGHALTVFFVMSAIYSSGMAFVGTAGPGPFAEFASVGDLRLNVYFGLTYVLLWLFVGLCGREMVRALAARAASSGARRPAA